MDSGETRILNELHDAELPRAMRGFQEDATRRLLTEAAGALQRAAERRDRLQHELRTLKSAAEDDDAPDAEAIGRALVVATSMSDQLVASAQEKAELMEAEAEAEAERLLAKAREEAEAAEREVAGQRDRLERDFAALKRDSADQREQLAAERKEALELARAETERMVREAGAEVDRLREEADALKAFVEAKTNAFVGIAQAALEQLEGLDQMSHPPAATAGAGGAPLRPQARRGGERAGSVRRSRAGRDRLLTAPHAVRESLERVTRGGARSD